MSSTVQALLAEFRPFAVALVDAAARAGLQPRITSTLRSHAQQARLYRRFLAGLAPYPVAPPGTSAHELGLAFDLIVTPLEAIRDLADTWETWGGIWGGRFGDEVHFESPIAKSLVKGRIQRILESPGFEAATFFLPTPLTYTTGQQPIDQLAQRLASYLGL